MGFFGIFHKKCKSVLDFFKVIYPSGRSFLASYKTVSDHREPLIHCCSSFVM